MLLVSIMLRVNNMSFSFLSVLLKGSTIKTSILFDYMTLVIGYMFIFSLVWLWGKSMPEIYQLLFRFFLGKHASTLAVEIVSLLW